MKRKERILEEVEKFIFIENAAFIILKQRKICNKEIEKFEGERNEGKRCHE